MAPPETSPALACPSLEEIAAFLEGRLDDADRERITAHIAVCDSCLELVAETALFLQENPLEERKKEDVSGRPAETGEVGTIEPLRASGQPGLAIPWVPHRASGRSSRRLRFLPLAAALVLAAGLGLYRQFFAPASFASAYGSLRQTDLTAVSAQRWQPRTFRSGAVSGTDLGNLERSFRAGVRTVDLQAGLEAGDRQGSLDSTRDLLRAIESARLIPRERKAFYESLLTKLEEPSVAEEDLAKAAREASQAAENLQPLLDESFLLLGQWAEAGRLAATMSAREFFEIRRHRRFLDQIRQDKRLDPEVQARLEEIRRIWDSGSLGDEDFRRLETLLDEIIDLSAGR